MRRLLAGVAVVFVLGAAACSRTNSKASVEAAIQQHLNRNPHLMLNSFSTHYQRVTLTGDEASALVKFQSKSNPALSVAVNYTLKKINGQWQVISSSSVNGQVSNPANPHAGVSMDQMPPPSSAPAEGASPHGSPAPVPSH